ncbi:hypothetical protein [Effusibacillus pohliae]|uniref:hypothetical protein n=1 Tax=Effusibacillus pohliae TaxID=232270 RepID=UPI000363DFAD|nr:hypothetical protein [Effusibacillus pohliae]
MKWLGWIVTGAVAVSGVGYWAYTHTWRTAPAPGPNVEQVKADSVFPDSFFDFSPVLHMTEAVAPQNGSAVPAGCEPRTVTSPQNGSAAPFGSKNLAGAPQSGSAAVEEPSSPVASSRLPIYEAAIKAKYDPAFDQLQREASSRLDQIVAKGLDEYRYSQATGSPSVQELVNKYSGAAKKLEASINNTFYQLLARMEHDLRQAGLPLDPARRVEAEYKASLQQKKAELIGKVINR